MGTKINYQKESGVYRISVNAHGIMFEAFATNIKIAARELCDTMASNIGGYEALNSNFPNLFNDIVNMEGAA